MIFIDKVEKTSELLLNLNIFPQIAQINADLFLQKSA